MDEIMDKKCPREENIFMDDKMDKECPTYIRNLFTMDDQLFNSSLSRRIQRETRAIEIRVMETKVIFSN